MKNVGRMGVTVLLRDEPRLACRVGTRCQEVEKDPSAKQTFQRNILAVNMMTCVLSKLVSNIFFVSDRKLQLADELAKEIITVHGRLLAQVNMIPFIHGGAKRPTEGKDRSKRDCGNRSRMVVLLWEIGTQARDLAQEGTT